jgi:Nif-specific regulatory protein
MLQPEDISLPRTDVSTSIKTSGMAASAEGSLIKTVEEMERQKITEVLKICGGVQARAAKTLGITPRQLGYKLKKYNIDIT